MFYAKQSPRGFANEINVFEFKTRAARDEWVCRHKDDGDVNSAYRGARACLARDAARIVRWRGDAITQSFNSGFIDGDELLRMEREREAAFDSLHSGLR